MSARTILEKDDENLYILRADDLDVRYFEAISEILSSAGFRMVDVIDFRGAASEGDLEKIRESVRKLIES